MVFAMYVGSDRAPDRDVFAAWRHGKKEAPWQQVINDGRQAYRGFAMQNPRLGIKVQHAVEALA